MRCIHCKELLDIFPIYNAGKDDDFPPYLLICNNKDCPRLGLVTAVFGATEDTKEDAESEHKKI